MQRKRISRRCREAASSTSSSSSASENRPRTRGRSRSSSESRSSSRSSSRSPVRRPRVLSRRRRACWEPPVSTTVDEAPQHPEQLPSAPLKDGDAVPGNSRFQIVRRLGKGTFGEVYVAENCLTHAHIAVKIEPADAEPPQLEYEKRIMEELRWVTGVPKVHFYVTTPRCNVLGMQLLDIDVEKLRAGTSSGRLPVPIVTKIGYQTLQRLQALHERGLAHRDIKPNNIMLGRTGKDLPVCVYLIDFGLAKRVIYKGRHINLRDDKGLAGTPRYASIRAHMGYEQSRRDDIESLMYVLIFLAKGALPWQGLETATTMRYTGLKDKKREFSSAELCVDLPAVFTTTLQQAKRLKFDEMPDYEALLSEWSAAVRATGDVSLDFLLPE